MNANRRQILPGLILIVLGIVFLLTQYFEFGPGLFLILLGLIFLIPYAFTRTYGLLIPGCILAGIGVGLAFERTLSRPDITVSIGLGLGFVAIFLVQLIVAGSSHWWPLVPGVMLLLGGFAELAPQGQALLDKGWPLVLIAIGLAVLAGPYLWSRETHKN